MATSLADKLLIKPDTTVLMLNAPIGYAKKLEPLPAGVTVSDKRGKAAEVVMAFVRDSGELKRLASGFPALEEDAVLWVCYPQGGKAGTDLDRDTLNEGMGKPDLTGAPLVAVERTSRPMRFTP